MLKKHNLDLDPQDNKKFFSIWDEQNEIMQRWNDVNEMIFKTRVPYFFPWWVLRKLKENGKLTSEPKFFFCST